MRKYRLALTAVCLVLAALVLSAAAYAEEWTAPEGKREVQEVRGGASKEQLYFSDKPDSYAVSVYELSADGRDFEAARECRITFLGGDEHLRDFFTVEKDDTDNKAYLHGHPAGKAPGTAEFRADIVSDRYWATYAFRIVVAAEKDITAELTDNTINVPVDAEVMIGSLYNLAKHVKVVPDISYFCYLDPAGGQGTVDDENYSFNGEYITVKKAGDYPFELSVYIGGTELVFTFPVTVHASEEIRGVSIDGEAEPNRAYFHSSYDAAISETKGRIFETGDSILVYVTETDPEDKSEYAVIVSAWCWKDLTIPSEVDGFPVRKVQLYAYQVSGDTRDPYHTFTNIAYLENLTIGEGVREIAEESFKGCRLLKRAVLPESLVTIGESAFFHCTQLAEVNLPASVASIGRNAFVGIADPSLKMPDAARENCDLLWYCYDLKKDPSGAWTYGRLEDGTAVITAFEPQGKKLTVPAELDGIPVTMLSPDKETVISCRKTVSSVQLPDSLRIIDREAFYGVELNDLRLPKGLEIICDKAFESSRIKSLTLPDSLKVIGASAFEYCSLSKLKLPEGLEVIGDNAFHDNNITGEMVFPSTLKKLGDRAFDSNAPKGHSLSYRGKIYGIKKVVFLNAGTEIGKQVFNPEYGEQFDPYTDPTPANYEGNTFDALSVSCYPGSTADMLYQYNVKKSFLKWDEKGKHTAPAEKILQAGCLETGDPVYELTIPEGVEEIADNAFSGMATLVKVTLPASLRRIGARAFSGCVSLSEVVQPKQDDVRELGEYAFEDCAITQYKISDGAESIPDGLFKGCASLNKVTLPKTGLVRIGEYAFSGCTSLKQIDQSSLKEVTSLGRYAFEGCPITSFTVNEGVAEIPDGLFKGCESLKKVDLPETGLVRIGDEAFYYCRSLEGIILPEGLTSIGKAAFRQHSGMAQYTYLQSNKKKAYSALKAIELPASLESIGEEAFAACDALKSVTIPAGSRLKTIGKYTFAMCIRLEGITLPDSVTDLGEGAFVNCVTMKEADLGQGVENAGDSLFNYCWCLKKLKVPDSLTSIGAKILEEHPADLTVQCSEGSAMDQYLQKNYPDIHVTRE